MLPPMPDAVLMTCLHKYRQWSLFRVDGEPRVLKRWSIKRTSQSGRVTEESGEEWGGLDADHMTPAARKVMVDAWEEWKSWANDNARVAL